jgi:hypothetical protein
MQDVQRERRAPKTCSRYGHTKQQQPICAASSYETNKANSSYKPTEIRDKGKPVTMRRDSPQPITSKVRNAEARNANRTTNTAPAAKTRRKRHDETLLQTPTMKHARYTARSYRPSKSSATPTHPSAHQHGPERTVQSSDTFPPNHRATGCVLFDFVPFAPTSTALHPTREACCATNLF